MPESAAQEAAPKPDTASRPLTQVVVGVLLREDGRYLLASRPDGKVYAGYWEFPGGKLEPGESVAQALVRELREELSIEVRQLRLWRRTQHDYPHALVCLNFCLVTQWEGEPLPQEGQLCAWQSLPPEVNPLLPGTLPVLDWFVQTPPHELWRWARLGASEALRELDAGAGAT